jgi:hypothetical protein
MVPRNGCPGPVEIPLTPEITAIALNTPWWVHTSTRPLGKKDGCSISSEEEIYQKLEVLLEKNKNKQVLVAAHHPLYSNAAHGGNFHLKQHLFPLTAVHKKAYIPMPLLGSVYPLYRKYVGVREDMAHPKYRNFRNKLIPIVRKYDNLVWAAGHDHNLQYIKKGRQHHLVSGAGSKVGFVKKGGPGVVFTHAHVGFMRLDYYSGEVWLQVIEPEEGKPEGKVAFRQKII